MTGRFFAVVGPSGAGKDTLIDFARAALADSEDFAFPRRIITRPHDAGGEDHIAVSREEFDRLRMSGGFMVHWEAHGLGYGIPAEVEALLADDVHVIANLSRGAIEALCKRVDRVHVIHVTAPLEIIATRLAERGRESGGDIKERLARAGYELPTIAPVTTINNAGTPEAGGAELVHVLKQNSRSAGPGPAA